MADDMERVQHLIRKYSPQSSSGPPGGCLISFSGAVFRRQFLPAAGAEDFGLGDNQDTIPRNQDYLGWIDLLDAVDENDRSDFTVVELGAGCGVWLINAACLMRTHHPEKSVRLVGVEAEPSHFAYMQQAFRDNGLEPVNHRLAKAAVGGHTGLVWFYTGESSEWYGQSVVPERHVRSMLNKNRLPADYLPREEGEILETTNVYPNRREVFRDAVSARMISLSDLIGDIEFVDFLHADIQGNELEVIETSRELIDAKVRMIHIGTHSTEIEEGLRRVFASLGWEKRWDFPRKSESETPFGTLIFGDGVQSYLNPRLT